MKLSEIKHYITDLIGHVTFEYNGYNCGIDPFSHDSYDIWYGEESANVDSIDKVMNLKFFNGKSLSDIWDDVTEVCFFNLKR